MDLLNILWQQYSNKTNQFNTCVNNNNNNMSGGGAL